MTRYEENFKQMIVELYQTGRSCSRFSELIWSQMLDMEVKRIMKWCSMKWNGSHSSSMAITEKNRKKPFKKIPFTVKIGLILEQEDTFLCPNGQRAPFKRYRTRQDAYGFKRQLKIYECEDCSTYMLRLQCMKGKEPKNRTLQKNMSWEYFKAYTKHKLSEEKTGFLYRQRKVDVEPAFAYLKAHLRFTRLSARG